MSTFNPNELFVAHLHGPPTSTATSFYPSNPWTGLNFLHSFISDDSLHVNIIGFLSGLKYFSNM